MNFFVYCENIEGARNQQEDQVIGTNEWEEGGSMHPNFQFSSSFTKKKNLRTARYKGEKNTQEMQPNMT